MLRLIFHILTLVGYLTLQLGYSTLNAQPSTKLENRPEKQYVDFAGIWPRLEIPVCLKGILGFDTELEWIREAVHKHIEQNSRYVFPPTWLPCNEKGSSRIEITVSDIVGNAQPNSLVGYQCVDTPFGCKEKPTAMVLNLTFQHWGQDCQPKRRRCIENIAVHEFMHALGFLHEQLYPDLARIDQKCAEKYKELNKNDNRGVDPHPLRGYDPDTLMNYCRDIYKEDVRLSKHDKEVLAFLSDASQIKMTSIR